MKICGRAYVNGAIGNYSIFIENGKIQTIKKGTEVKKVRGIILPAGVDIHVHFRDPGFTYKEDFSTGSLSAAFGGISCCFDMPNTDPKVLHKDDFEEKKSIAKSRSYVDFGIYCMAAKGCDKNIECSAYKLYMTDEKVKEAEGIKKLVAFHCEKKDFFNFDYKNAKNVVEYAKFRNERAEVEAVKEIKPLQVKKHIVHISSIGSLGYADCTKEVTPHHLLLDFKKLNTKDGKYKVNPPLRNNGAELLKALNMGKIEMIASDHAPHTLEEKEDFESAPAGMPGVETTYPLMLSLVKKRILPLNRVIECFCENPAKLMGIKKGKIKEGYDGDLIFVDFADEKRIDERDLHSKCEWSPYNGFSAIFPHALMVRGKYVVEENESVGHRGYGKEQSV